MQIINLTQIKEIIKVVDIITPIERGFVDYSKGNAIVPPIGELLFEDPPGEVHIKYGYILEDDYFVVKIASGFYENSKINLPSSNGLILLFNKHTGALVSILLDEGLLTNVRTAVAGAIVAKYLAPQVVNSIGIIGTGTQAKLQLLYLQKVISCKKIMIFGRNSNNLLRFQAAMIHEGLEVHVVQSLEEITKNCNLIVTTTHSSLPILCANQIKPGTHITAVGADTAHKQELHEDIFSIADLIVADSVSQCIERGELAHAIRKKFIKKEQIAELGNIIAGTYQRRTHDDQITVADLTGLAVQDIQIAKTVFQHA